MNTTTSKINNKINYELEIAIKETEKFLSKSNFHQKQEESKLYIISKQKEKKSLINSNHLNENSISEDNEKNEKIEKDKKNDDLQKNKVVKSKAKLSSSTITDTNMNLFKKYLNQLSLYNFPDFPSKIMFDSNEEIEQLFKFFDDIINLKSSIIDEKKTYFSTIQSLKYENMNLSNSKLCMEKEISILNMKNKDLFNKIKTKNEFSDEKSNVKSKEVTEVRNEFNKIQYKYNQMMIEKKSMLEKISKLSDALNKSQIQTQSQSSKSKMNIRNSFEITEGLKRNNFLKRLSKIDGYDLLIEILKNGYNNTLKELIFEITSLKEFIIEVNEELIRLFIEKNEKSDMMIMKKIDKKYVDLSFIETNQEFRKILFYNINLLLISENKASRYGIYSKSKSNPYEKNEKIDKTGRKAMKNQNQSSSNKNLNEVNMSRTIEKSNSQLKAKYNLDKYEEYEYDQQNYINNENRHVDNDNTKEDLYDEIDYNCYDEESVFDNNQLDCYRRKWMDVLKNENNENLNEEIKDDLYYI